MEKIDSMSCDRCEDNLLLEITTENSVFLGKRFFSMELFRFFDIATFCTTLLDRFPPSIFSVSFSTPSFVHYSTVFTIVVRCPKKTCQTKHSFSLIITYAPAQTIFSTIAHYSNVPCHNLSPRNSFCSGVPSHLFLI